jgi:nicotinamide riboside transporter PnuC
MNPKNEVNMEPSASAVAQTLQILGWALTLLGQVLNGLRRRQGFILWVAANVVMIGLAAYVGLWWSIGMYTTNTLVCLWSYRQWRLDEQPLRPMVERRSSWLGRVRWN